MSLIFSIYSKDAFREYILPSLRDADHTITLRQDEFHLADDVRLQFEVIDGEWKLRGTPEYVISEGEQSFVSRPLRDRQVLGIRTADGVQLSVLITEGENAFRPYDKFRLRDVRELTIGRDAGCDIVYDFMGIVSRRHARIVRSGDHFCLENLSPNGSYVNGHRVTDTEELKFGDYINIVGLHMVFLGNLLAVDTADRRISIREGRLTQSEGTWYDAGSSTARKVRNPGKRIYHRAPRAFAPVSREPIQVEGAPPRQELRRASLAAAMGPLVMILPAALGCFLMVSGNGSGNGSMARNGLILSAASVVIAVIWAFFGALHQSRAARKDEKLRQERYDAYLEEKTQEIQKRHEQTRRLLESVYPAPELCLQSDETGGSLWNRNISHRDFLIHRLGLGDVPFSTEIRVPQRNAVLQMEDPGERAHALWEEYRLLHDAPVTVDLSAHRLIGIVGGKDRKGAVEVAQTLATQLAAGNCYTDVKMAFLYAGESSRDYEQWEFARWLPHVWSEDGKHRYLAAGNAEASEVLFELTKVFRARSEQNAAAGPNVTTEPITAESGPRLPRPYYVVFVSELAMLEGEPFMKYMSEKDPACGLTTILLAESYEQLPNSCDYIIENTEHFRGVYSVSGSQAARKEIRFDTVDNKALDAFARRLASLRVLEVEESRTLPEQLSFFEMLQIRHPQELDVRERWAKNRTYENIRGQLGVKAGGDPCFLDVHEKYHGPHGLVAGTTGSGKSETLQTWMLSLAVNYSPDDVAFFIIDYKGGGMANQFRGLPHLAGQISNLSGNQIRRAMISIKSENRRRQQIFNENGVNHIDQYTRLFKDGEVEVPVPHLFIIIDEFAELKQEEPAFMRELISVAQVGRSLGVHLILATQKPGGVVDDNIRSNSRFRLCLRVQDRQDSMEILHRMDAAYINRAGRGYLQVGSDEVYEQFQSGYSGAPYDENAEISGAQIARMITGSGRVEMAGVSRRVAHGKSQTELDAVRDHLAKVARENGYTASHALWLPPLGREIYLEDLGAASEHKAHSLQFQVGLWDDPANQRQMPMTLDLLENGNMAVCGSIVSGKSTMLQTIAWSLITCYTPDQINLYAIDYSSSMMDAFREAPHFGAVMLEDEEEKTEKFFHMMDQILIQRKAVLRGGSFRQYNLLHRDSMPAIVIMVDNYSAFKERTGERYENNMIRLSREGLNHGIYLIITGARFGINDITTRVAENMNTVLTLAQPDRYAYGELLHTMQIDMLPEQGVKGRGLASLNGRILEYQGALALRADNDYQRMESIAEACRKMAENWQGEGAREVPMIPDDPDWESFRKEAGYRRILQSGDCLPVGYDAENAEVYGIPLQEIYCYTVCGRHGTGKSNFLKVCILAALEQKAEVELVDGPSGMLRSFAAARDIPCKGDVREIYEMFEDRLPEIRERSTRRKELLADGSTEEDVLRQIRREYDPICFVIGDLAWFVRKVQETAESDYDMSGFLENILSKGSGLNIYFIGAVSLKTDFAVKDSPVFRAFIDHGTGIHFGGNAVDNLMLDFGSMSYARQSAPERPGIGLIPGTGEGGTARRIVVPEVRE